MSRVKIKGFPIYIELAGDQFKQPAIKITDSRYSDDPWCIWQRQDKIDNYSATLKYWKRTGVRKTSAVMGRLELNIMWILNDHELDVIYENLVTEAELL